MKPLLLLMALLLPGLADRAAAAEILTVAIFDFDSRDEAVRDLGSKVSVLVNAYLSAEPDLITVERAELEKILGEQELGLSGTISADSAARVGQLTGAKVLVTGRVFRIDKELVMVAKIMGTETSRVYGEVVKGSSASLTDMSGELAGKIAKTVTEKGVSLVAKVVPREERIDKLAASLKPGNRPVISVRIPEQHFGAPVIDPAAETELSLILQRAGFTVVDGASKQKPEIEITGEAFSAYAMRKGNLISCRARVEVKAVETATGRILVSERQTSVAVDLAEQTAAKTALQNAAMELAERLAPRLAR
jgi:hypothetical protein